MAYDPPRGVLGATGGVLGTLTLLPLARGAAMRIFPPPRLPGAALRTGDLKGATYLEVLVLLALIPAAAFLFGHWIPRLLARDGGAPGPLFELPGAVFGSAYLFWRMGTRPVHGILAALGLAAAATALLVRSRRPSFLVPADRRALREVFLAGALWAFAWRAAPTGTKIVCPNSPVIVPASGSVFALLALGASKARRQAPA
jgi:hypothetical protein